MKSCLVLSTLVATAYAKHHHRWNGTKTEILVEEPIITVGYPISPAIPRSPPKSGHHHHGHHKATIPVERVSRVPVMKPMVVEVVQEPCLTAIEPLVLPVVIPPVMRTVEPTKHYLPVRTPRPPLAMAPTIVEIVKEPEPLIPEPAIQVANTTLVKKCFQVPVALENTCYLPITTQQPYPCPKKREYESCIEDFEEIPARCHRTVAELVTYDCPIVETERLCSTIPISVPKTCTEEQISRVAKPCTKTIDQETCKVVAREVDDSCQDLETFEEEYPCWTTEISVECDVKHEVKMKKCKRTIQSEVPYTYEGVDVERQCRIQDVESSGNCQRQVERQQEYPCPEIIQERECRPTTKLIQKPCTQTGSQVETYDCSETKEVPIEKTCHRPITRVATVERCEITVEPLCADSRGQSTTKLCTPQCIQEDIEYTEYECYPCTETVTTIVPKVCHREVPVQQTSMCVEEVPDEFCFTAPKRVEKTCSRPIIETEVVACTAIKSGEVCRDVEKRVTRRGFKFASREEEYDCPDTHLQENCRELSKPKLATCAATLVRERKIPCKRQIFEEECQISQVDISQMCIEDAAVRESFQCYDYKDQEKCVSVPVYKIGQCKTLIEKDEAYDCTRRVPKLVCSKALAQDEHTCFREVTTDEPHKCYDKSQTEQCVELPISNACIERPKDCCGDLTEPFCCEVDTSS